MLGKIQAAEDGLRAKAYVTRTALRPRFRSPVQGAIAKELRQNESRTAPKRRFIQRVFTSFDPQIYHRSEAKKWDLGDLQSDMTQKDFFHDSSLRAFEPQGYKKNYTLGTWNLESYGILWNPFKSYGILWNPIKS